MNIFCSRRCPLNWIYLPLFALLLAAKTVSFQPSTSSQFLTRGFAPMGTFQVHVSQHTETVEEEMTVIDIPDEKLWGLYCDAMSEVMASGRAVKKEKKETIKKVHEYLISKESLPGVPSPLQSTQSEFQAIMANQAVRFRAHYNFTKTECQFVLRCLVYFGDACAKRRLGSVVAVSWHKLKEAGMIPRENCISTHMYSLNTDADNESSPIIHRTLDELVTFHDLIFPPNEKTIFLRMKNMIGKGDIAGAENVLFSLPDKGGGGDGEWKKLRTFQPVLEYYCSIGDASSILRLLKDMRASAGVIMDAETYAEIVGSLAKFGFFCDSTTSIEGTDQASLSVSYGPELFDEIATSMGQDLLELTEAAANRIFDGFVEGFRGPISADEGNGDSAKVDSSQWNARKCMSYSGLKIGRVDIEHSTGLCPETGTKLRLFHLDEEERQHVHDQLLEMARLGYQEFIKGKKNKGNYENQDYGFEQLSRFSRWLDNRKGKPFTAVVDGANVAYFGFPQLHYSQVRLVVDKLRHMGENPLVILPKKYTYSTFMLSSTSNSQRLSERDLEVIKCLGDEGALYTVPPRCLDDYFWMLASVSNQTLARNGCDLAIPPDNAAGRLPGLRPILITNDQMRDHKLDLLEPREFRRWCSCHIVNYDISPVLSYEWDGTRNVQFSPADFFSREIQGNRHGTKDAIVWHFPVVNWDKESRLCVSITRE